MIVVVFVCAPLVTNSGQQARPARIVTRLHRTRRTGYGTLHRWFAGVDGTVYYKDNGTMIRPTIDNWIRR